MSRWNDPDAWQAMLRGEACGICRRELGWDPVAELEVSSVMASEDAPMRGYCWVPFGRHAVELHDLSEGEAAAYIRDLRRVSAAVQRVTHAVKLNYEIHGNTVPHLHAHIFPRYVGDRFENRPIDPRSVTEPVYAAGEFGQFRDALRAALTGERP